MARKLRIAASVFFAVATAALCVLWVRSLSTFDLLSHDGGTVTTFGSASGYVYLIRMKIKLPVEMAPNLPYGWQLSGSKAIRHPATFEWSNNASSTKVRIPYWFLAAVSGTVAFAPWIRRRYSLRTMLIVFTWVAVILGIAVYNWQR